MSIDVLAVASAKWLWDQYGKDITSRAFGDIKKKWSEFKWTEAEAQYKARLRDQHSTTRLLGYPRPISIEGVFTDVYTLDQLTAFRKYEITEFQSKVFERDALRLNEPRRPLLNLVSQSKRLYILGKPGAGKTTLLKFMVLQACDGKFSHTPIFVSLKEWADSHLDLIDFIVQQFDICAFPDAKAFIEYMLKKGRAITLFDGLDEVREAEGQRSEIISIIVNFVKRYPDIKVLLTCRVAASEYSFDQFDYIEIADFDEKQIQTFAAKWYRDDQFKFQKFLLEFNKAENVGLHELGRTPLLLALLCLVFDDNLTFPKRRADLYKEAVEALLKRWDASRGIQRDETYHKLSSRRKEQLLARIATENFVKEVYFIRRDTLVQQIENFIKELPPIELGNIPADGEAVLNSIESQHGLITERARGIYSFSHLTFQEYFVARYVVENAAVGLPYLFDEGYFTEVHWREVFLLVASLLDNADGFMEIFFQKMSESIRDEKICAELLKWANEKAKRSKHPTVTGRALFIFIALIVLRINIISHARAIDISASRHLKHVISIAFDLPLKIESKIDRNVVRDMSVAFRQATSESIEEALNKTKVQALARTLGVQLQEEDFNWNWTLNQSQVHSIFKYLRMGQLMVECFHLGAFTDREHIANRMLLP